MPVQYVYRVLYLDLQFVIPLPVINLELLLDCEH